MKFKNFVDLEEAVIEKHGTLPKNVKNNVEKNIKLLTYMGDIVETYLPKFFSVLIGMNGGDMKSFDSKLKNQSEKDKHYPNQA